MHDSKWSKDDPRYIKPQDFLTACVRDRLEYRRITALEEQNEIERERIVVECERNYIMLVTIKRSVIGMIVASTIGAMALIYTNIVKEGQGQQIDLLLKTMVNFKKVQSDLHYIANSQRQSDKEYREDKVMLKNIHKKLFPEEYKNDFGR